MATFINFNTPTLQLYSLPKDIIDHLAKYCNLKSSYKLMKSCKLLRIRQTQIGKDHAEYLAMERNDATATFLDVIQEPDPKLYCSFKNPNDDSHQSELSAKGKLYFEFKQVKIWGGLILNYLSKNEFEPLMDLFDLSEIKQIDIAMKFFIKHKFILKMLQPSLTKLFLAHYDDSNEIFFRAFENCQNLSSIIISGKHVNARITKEDLKRLISNNRRTKFKHCSLFGLEKVEVSDIFEFIEKHMDPNGRLLVNFAENDEIFKSDLKKEREMRLKNKIPTCFLTL